MRAEDDLDKNGNHGTKKQVQEDCLTIGKWSSEGSRQWKRQKDID